MINSEELRDVIHVIDGLIETIESCNPLVAKLARKTIEPTKVMLQKHFLDAVNNEADTHLLTCLHCEEPFKAPKSIGVGCCSKECSEAFTDEYGVPCLNLKP